jgi:predicted metallo-beta-lactamase superfamily hydrolase
MPIVSAFFGITIRLFHSDHNPPHFHAYYGEYEAIVEISSGKILAGKLPPKCKSLVEEWRNLHQTEIEKAWGYVSSMRTPKKIKGLE